MHATRQIMKSIISLRQRADFLLVQQGGRKWVSNALILQARANGGDQTRFGITVSKKLNKRAVGRNRMRRRLRAAAYDVLTLYAAPGHDFVLIGRNDTATYPYAALCEDMKWCLKKMGLTKDATS